MAKFTFFVLIILLLLLGILAFFNKGSLDITVWEGITYQIPVVALILISSAGGILSILLIFAVRDARRYFDNWQIQRRLRKDTKIKEQYLKGLDAFYAQRYEEAEDIFRNVILDEPSHMNSLLRLGDISLSRKEFTKAADSYLKAGEVRPRSVEVLLSLVKAYEIQGKWQDALRYLDNILDIDSENIMALYRKRDIYESSKKWEELINVQHRILKCNLPSGKEEEEGRRLTGYKYEQGRNLLETGSADKAMKVFRNILKTDRDFRAAYIALAEAYLREGNTKDAEDILMRGYETTHAQIFLARLEDHYIAEGEPGNIIDLYQKAIRNNPKDFGLQFFLAKLYYRLEMIDHAFETISNIDTSAFDISSIHALSGNIYARRGQYENAVEKYRKALQVDRPLLVPFCCSKCNTTSYDWSGRCPECRQWNTMVLDINEACKIQKRQSST